MPGKTLPGLVSTVIPVYNRAGMVRSAVQSVLDQTYRPIEIILVDDGSTDETLAELHAVAEEHPDEIQVAHRQNGGPGPARETGRKLARGEFIQYFDSDDVLMPRKFEVQVAALQNNPDCDIAYCRSSLIDSDGKTLRNPSKWTGRKFDTLFPALLVDRWWHTHTPLYRTSLCDRIGEWPAKRPEDWDVDARAGALGTRLVFCDELLSCQRQHDGHRVTKWSMEAYREDEAWFLPRLFDCAVRAGIAPGCPEMRHFSRWAFLHVRLAVKRRDIPAAERFLELARTAAGSSTDLKVFRALTRLLGWRVTAGLTSAVSRLKMRRAGEQSLSLSDKETGEEAEHVQA